MTLNMEYSDLGVISFDDALELQQALLSKSIDSGPGSAARLLLAEHDPAVITIGRAGRQEHVLATPAQLAALNVRVRRISRGGDVTWHGRGQLVAYPIVRLDPQGIGLRQYIRGLEEAVIAVLRRLGISGRRVDGMTGVWVGQEKIAAIGVAVRRWVTYHGLSINVGPDLSGFSLIVPCGLAQRGVTSISRQLGKTVSVEDVKRPLVEELARILGFQPLAAGVPPTVSSPQSAILNPQSAIRRRLPQWLHKPLAPAGRKSEVLAILEEFGLSTVCRGARCPNLPQCHAGGTATFLILGDRCTRTCGFCAMSARGTHAQESGTGVSPVGSSVLRGREQAQPTDGRDAHATEPAAVAKAAARMGLRHVVVTGVTRDDLPDGGAAAFAATIMAIRQELPQATIEALTSDFAGCAEALHAVLAAGPDVFNHNVETVPRLYEIVRPQADYARSLDVLRQAAAFGGVAWVSRLCVAARTGSGRGADPQANRDGPHGQGPRAAGMLTKSGLMVGLGETDDEVVAVLRDLRGVGCQLVTIGQYLSPSPKHLPVERYVEPAQFERWRSQAMEMGFKAVMAGPFVRSSYHAADMIAGP